MVRFASFASFASLLVFLSRPDAPCVIWVPGIRHSSTSTEQQSLSLIVADFDADLARHHQAAFGWALACCRWDRSAAEDVLQTSYLKIVEGRARYSNGAEFRAVLFGVIRRTASEERRRRAVRATLSLGLL